VQKLWIHLYRRRSIVGGMTLDTMPRELYADAEALLRRLQGHAGAPPPVDSDYYDVYDDHMTCVYKM
jgi:hypothetical protein